MADCNSCPSNGECSSQETCGIKNNPFNDVKRIIGVMSGKGGVGKSTISVLLATQLRDMGFKVGIMDADITGPSIPRLLGIEGKRAGQNEMGLLPVVTDSGISVMSLNLLIDDEQQPVIWRGPIISSTVKQFWEDVFWDDLDYLIVDLPPGTGDVALTVMQSVPISGMLIVGVPQDMVSMIVAKAVNMVSQLNIKNIGVVQNMSYIECPDCDKKIKMFDADNSVYDKLNVPLLGELPMTLDIASIAKNGGRMLSEHTKSTIADITNQVIESVNSEKAKKQ